MKNIRTLFFCLLALVLTGCGHNIGTSSKGIGINLSWTSGSYLPNLAVGYWDINQAVVRGNSTYTVNTATGGGVTSLGGTAQTIELKSGPQFNEGNVREVLVEPTVHPDVKLELIKNLNTSVSPKSDSFSVKTSNAAAASGDKLLEVKPLTSGLNKVVETVGEVASTAVEKIPEAATKVSADVKSSTENIKKSVDGAKDIMSGIKKTIDKYSTPVIVLLSILLALIGLMILKSLFLRK